MAVDVEYRRLPQDVKPVHYSISIFDLNLGGDDLTYRGTTHIDVTVRTAISKIILNGHKLRRVEATLLGDNQPRVKHVSNDESTQRLIIHLDRELEASSSPVTLSLNYEATIDRHLTGFYRSQEDSISSETHAIFCTQFQPSDARRAFPCFDEPDFKATFHLEVEVANGLTVLSNMPVESSMPSEKTAGHTVFSFQHTPIMSTYLLAWAIGKLQCIETNIARRYSNEPLPIRVYTRPDLSRQAEFALGFAGRVIEYFSGLFGIDYPLPKLDLLAVSEMSDDAMENWGLVIFRSTALLLDDAASDPDPGLRTRVAYIIAHELAHQWFGNLVTMTWWDELWLNEGFATWAGWDACDFLYPEWDVWGQFVADDMQEAFELDALPSSHPVQVPVLDGLEVDSIFDSISYLKGASKVRMLIAYLDRDVFLRGLSKYLSAHQYQNTTADSLWSALEGASGKPVARSIQLWIKTMGFPVVSVQSEAANGGKELLLKQSPISSPEESSRWFIPILQQTSAGIQRHIFDSTTINVSCHGDLVELNVDRQGFFRTHLTPATLSTMSESLSSLSTRDQAGLLADTMAMAFNNRNTSTSDVLILAEKLSAQAGFVVWTSILSCLSQIQSAFSSDREITNGLQAFTRKLLQAHIDRLGWHPHAKETYSTQRLRPLLLSAAGLASDKHIIAKARQLFEALHTENNSTHLHPHLRETVLHIATSKIGLEATSLLQNLYHKTQSPHEREAIARAMGQVPTAPDASECLLRSFSSAIAAQDLRTLAVSVASNPAVPGVAWTFMRENWDLVCERLAGSMAIFEPFVRGCLRTLNSSEDAVAVRAFFAGKDTLGYGRGLRVAVDMINANAAYKAREMEAVREWLRTEGYLGQMAVD